VRTDEEKSATRSAASRSPWASVNEVKPAMSANMKVAAGSLMGELWAVEGSNL
jgi:hypothetical protein